jgi:hypothetical protein
MVVMEERSKHHDRRAAFINHLEACFPTIVTDYLPAIFSESMVEYLPELELHSYRPSIHTSCQIKRSRHPGFRPHVPLARSGAQSAPS